MLPIDNGQFSPMAGGAPANVAVAVAKLGGNSFFIGGISNDNLGQFLQQQLTANNVDINYSALKANKTALVLVTLDQDGERSFEFYRDDTADLAYTETDLASVQWQQDGILHLCSNTLCTEQQHQLSVAALESAKSNNMSICLDVNLRLNLWPEQEIAHLPKRIEQVFGYTDIIKLSQEELEWLASSKQVNSEQYVNELVQGHCKLVLITDGGNDIKAITKHQQQSITPPTRKAVDTTGAGDSFIGGFLYQLASKTSGQTRQAVFSSPLLIEEFVKFASLCGAHTVTSKGAFAAMPTKADLGLET